MLIAAMGLKLTSAMIQFIESGYWLLYSDRDFDPFIEHPGLLSAFT